MTSLADWKNKRPFVLGQSIYVRDSKALMPCPFTGTKMCCAGLDILSQSKNFCACTKTNFTECKSSFCLAQNACYYHNMQINVWTGALNLDQPPTFWDLALELDIELVSLSLDTNSS